jgi:hypothetical protein|tara:strand:+ start:620 stop:1006 length:387 start_codon:yes stop_codon:yes gene_type:complete
MLGHGALAEFAIGSVRGGGVQNVGSPFVSGVAITSSVGDETVTTSVAISPSTNVVTFSLGTEIATGGATVSPTTAGAITVSVGEEAAFGESLQNLITLSTGSPDFFIWNEVDDSQTVDYSDVEPGSTD